MTNKKRYIYSLLNSEGKNTPSSYDFIANNYYTMTKDELKDIILELDYALSWDSSYEDVAEELKDRWSIHTADEQAFGIGDAVTYDNDSSQAVLIVQGIIENEDGRYSYLVRNADGFCKEFGQDELSEA